MKTILVPTYHSLKDPILEGHMLKYLQRIGEMGMYQFVLITYEQPSYQLSKEEIIQMKEDLGRQGIIWKPRKYMTGGSLMIFKKMLNFLSAIAIAVNSLCRFQIVGILGFTSVSGGIGALLSFLSGKKLIIFCFEPHSLYMKEFGIWSEDSIEFRVLNWLERFQVRKASHLLVPTSFSVELVKDWGTNAEVHIMPFCVDDQQFVFKEEARNSLRPKLLNKNTDKKVLLYLGKFGGIYYQSEKVISFYEGLLKQSNSYHFLVICPGLSDEVRRNFKESSLPSYSYTLIPGVRLEEVSAYISASDIGMLAVPPLPSQRYRSPIKTANYLLCGLPYIVNEGIADDDVIAKTYNVGIVVDDFHKVDYFDLNKQIESILSGDTSKKRAKYREIGLKFRRLGRSVDLLNHLFGKLG